MPTRGNRVRNFSTTPSTPVSLLRRICAVARVFSLLMCLATIIIWAHSYWTQYNLLYVGSVNHDRFSECRVDFQAGMTFIQWFTVHLKHGQGPEFDRRVRNDDPTWHRGWGLHRSDAPGFTGPKALVRSLWKVELASFDNS